MAMNTTESALSAQGKRRIPWHSETQISQYPDDVE